MVCVTTYHHHNHTKLHYTTTKHKHTHTHKYTLTNKNTHSYPQKTIHCAPCRCISLPAGFHNFAIRELLFPFLSLLFFVYRNYCILLYVYVISTYVYVYIYCCFRYLNGVCPIRDGHCGHQNTNTVFVTVWAS